MEASRRWDWLITVRRGKGDVTGRARATIGHQQGRKLPPRGDRPPPSRPVRLQGVREMQK